MATQTVLQEVEAGVLGAIGAALKSNQPMVESWLTTGEGDVQAGLVNLIKNIPTVKGALGLVAGPVEGAVEAGIEAYVASVLAKYNSAELFTLLVSLVTHLQANV
jgi:hypothetical protein